VKLGPDGCALGKRNRNGPFVSAEFRGKPAHEVDNHRSAAIGKFHVHPIGTGLGCHHKELSDERDVRTESRYRRPSQRVPGRSGPQARCNLAKSDNSDVEDICLLIWSLLTSPRRGTSRYYFGVRLTREHPEGLSQSGLRSDLSYLSRHSRQDGLQS